MTRTELLSLAERLQSRNGNPTGFGLGPVCDEAAAILRKLAELRPVAWCLGIPKYAHSSNIIAANEFTPDAELDDNWVALYQLSEVLTDE